MDIGKVLVGLADAIETATVTEAAKQIKSPDVPEDFDITKRVLVCMMRQNTGASILDSGGAYGRAWQRNLARDFSNVEAATMKARVYTGAYGKKAGQPELSLDVTIDLFTYLSSRLDYDRALTRQFRKFAAELDNENKGYIALMEEFPKYIAEKRGADCEHVWTGNSYNEDNFLSGTVQYTQFDLDGTEYILLQIHGGCDVRGGYTAPQVFALNDNCDTFGDWYQAEIFPDRDEVEEIQNRLREGLDLQTFLFPEAEANLRAEVASIGDEVNWTVGGDDYHGNNCRKLDDYPVIEIGTRGEWRRGFVCVLPDHRALCPEIGAVLRASFCY